MGRNRNNLKTKKSLILPIYIFYVLFFEIILGFGISDIWDRLVARSVKKNKRSTV